MAVVQIHDVKVLDNPALFTNPFSFQITFQVMQELPDDIEWKVTYVGSAADESCDQVLEEVLVGPLVVGTNSFVLQTNTVDYSKIPNNDILGVTVVLVTCSYLDREFVRIGYYVRNEYAEEYDLENPPNPVNIDLVSRTILDDQPRVTYFAIDWGVGGTQDLYPPRQDEVDEGDGEVIDGHMIAATTTKAAAGVEENMSDNQNEEGDEEDDDDDELGEDDDDEEEDEDSTGDMEIDINEDSMDVAGMQNENSNIAAQ